MKTLEVALNRKLEKEKLLKQGDEKRKTKKINVQDKFYVMAIQYFIWTKKLLCQHPSKM